MLTLKRFMKPITLKISFLLTMLFAMSNIQAQNFETAMADQFRADGKIYVVIAVMAIVFVGITIYLFTIDRKISKLEKSLKDNPS
jgi:CcmD family protein